MINKKRIFLYFKKITFNCEDENDGKNYRYFHAIRVLTLAQDIALKEGLLNVINLDLLWILALFHDLGHNKKLLSEEQYKSNNATKDNHNSELFEKNIYPLIEDKELVQELKLVVNDFSDKKFKNIESRIVKDADDLDELGILNFWRMAVFAGKNNQDPQEVIDFFYENDLLDKKNKIDKLFINYSKEVGTKRIFDMVNIMDNFRDLNRINIVD